MEMYREENERDFVFAWKMRESSLYSSGISPMEKHIMLCRHQSLRRVRRMYSQHVYGCATKGSVRRCEKRICKVRAKAKHSLA